MAWAQRRLIQYGTQLNSCQSRFSAALRASNFPAGYQMSLETSCPNNDISRLVAVGIGIGEKRMTRRTRATSDCHIDLEVYSKCMCVLSVCLSVCLCCLRLTAIRGELGGSGGQSFKTQRAILETPIIRSWNFPARWTSLVCPGSKALSPAERKLYTILRVGSNWHGP